MGSGAGSCASTTGSMCGRITLTSPPKVVASTFGIEDCSGLQPRWNIAPSQQVFVVLGDAAAGLPGRRFESMRWGLVPGWVKDASNGPSPINARAETIAEKPSFRGAFRRRRCLVPADGFYEWQAAPSGKGLKQPYHIGFRDRQVFAIAGLWETWRAAPDAAELRTFTLLTTSPNRLMATIHHRMPVILPQESWDCWLDSSIDGQSRLEPLLRPCADDEMVARPVSLLVNNARHDAPDCLEEGASE